MNLFVAWQALTLLSNSDNWISALLLRPNPYLPGTFHFPDPGSYLSEGYTSAWQLYRSGKEHLQ